VLHRLLGTLLNISGRSLLAEVFTQGAPKQLHTFLAYDQ
jgi:hypothetical protein